MEIKADVKSIEKLKDYFFIVPDYQREYVWLADVHVARFLQDINDEFKPTSNRQSNYFIGSLIIVKREDGTFEVVDGQQRLTTIIIALCAVRETLANYIPPDEDLKTAKNEFLKIVNELLYKYDISSRRHTPRLLLQYSESKDYLNTLIEKREFKEKPTSSISRMQEAYVTIFDFLEQLKANNDGVLIGFIAYFLANVEMVIIKPDDLGSALKIFETINERGAGLNAMDLLKNLLFSNSNIEDFEVIKQTWKEIIKNLDESGEGDKPLRFLRYFLMARYHNGIIREEEIYKWMISEDGKSKIKYRSNPVEFAKEIKAASIKYRTFIKATTSLNADESFPNITGIGYLSKKTSKQHLLLLLALKETIDKPIIDLLAKNLESLMFYYAVNRILTKSYEEKFANWAAKLRKVNTMNSLLDFLNNDFKTELADQQDKFNSSFSSRNQGDLNPQYRIKYILGKIEEFIRSKVNFPSANFSFYQEQQLEHILPQTGANIPKSAYPNDFDYKNTVFKFGNLSLLEAPINQSINYSNDISSNEWFDAKRKAYLNSTILLTRTFSEIKIGEKSAFNGFATTNLKTYNTWDMQTVADRQEIMRKLILEIWKLYLA